MTATESRLLVALARVVLAIARGNAVAPLAADDLEKALREHARPDATDSC
jgi:hypothetical protein